MTEIFCLTADHPLWVKTAGYAERCSWRAGKVLAERMRSGSFKDFERVFAVFTDEAPAGFCTFTVNDALDEKYGLSPFIGFVFVGEEHRGNRLSEKMIRAALRYADSIGFKKVYISSDEKGLYEKYGFTKLEGLFDTIYGTSEQLYAKETG